jgi:hypothetical protein
VKNLIGFFFATSVLSWCFVVKNYLIYRKERKGFEKIAKVKYNTNNLSGT